MKHFFSSHGQTMTIKEFIELEVDERGNYQPEMIEEFVKVISSPCLPSGTHGGRTPVPMSVTTSGGGAESDDGDNGFLFAFKIPIFSF